MGRKSFVRKFRKSAWGEKATTNVTVWLVRNLAWSLRMKWLNRETMEDLYKSKRSFIFAYWHSDLILASRVGIEELQHHPIVVMTSPSRDGLLVSELLGRKGMAVVRASSKRGGMEGFRAFAKQLKAGLNGSMAVDGPRGPRRQVKSGIIRLSQMTGVPILPCAVGYHRKFSLNTWDRLRVPFPFTRAVVICGEPLYFPERLSKEETNTAAEELGRTITRLRNSLPYDND